MLIAYRTSESHSLPSNPSSDSLLRLTHAFTHEEYDSKGDEPDFVEDDEGLVYDTPSNSDTET